MKPISRALRIRKGIWRVVNLKQIQRLHRRRLRRASLLRLLVATDAFGVWFLPPLGGGLFDQRLEGVS